MQARKSSYGQLNQQKKQYKASALDDNRAGSGIRDYAKEEREAGVRMKNE